MVVILSQKLTENAYRVEREDSSKESGLISAQEEGFDSPYVLYGADTPNTWKVHVVLPTRHVLPHRFLVFLISESRTILC